MLREDDKLLQAASEQLKITAETKSIVFIYSKPKVGSTSLVSSLRLFALDQYHVLHLHDEEMMRVVCGVNSGVSINAIIQYNARQGKKVVVIDVYRNPVEVKMSTFFEKIDCHHFNNVAEEVNNYPVEKVIQRFNCVFPHIGNGDHFLDRFDLLTIPPTFDFENRHLYLQRGGIEYIKLRLQDSQETWARILIDRLNLPTTFRVLHDYSSDKKAIKDLYRRFKESYRLPPNLLEWVANDKDFRYFNDPSEQEAYLKKWSSDIPSIVPFTTDEYSLYERLCIENNHIDYIQRYHYQDEGCRCAACNMQRSKLIQKIADQGSLCDDRILHDAAVIEKKKASVKIRFFRVEKKPTKPSNSEKLKTSMTNIMGVKKKLK